MRHRDDYIRREVYHVYDSIVNYIDISPFEYHNYRHLHSDIKLMKCQYEFYKLLNNETLYFNCTKPYLLIKSIRSTFKGWKKRNWLEMAINIKIDGETLEVTRKL